MSVPTNTPTSSGTSSGTSSETCVVTVEIAEVVDDELVEVFERLIPQLSSSSPPPSRGQLTEMVDNDQTVLFVARLGDEATAEIVGSLTLAFYRIPTGLKAWIEDVVVAESARGHGVGIALSRAALDEARKREAKDVNLSSRPARDAANQLYLKLGFDVRDTNMYRYKF